MDWKDRLKNEAEELRIKINKLHEFMKTREFYKLNRIDKDLLYEQFHAMLNYLQILGKRLELHKIELDI